MTRIKPVTVRIDLIWETACSTICVWFPTFPESMKTLHPCVGDRWSYCTELNPDMFEQQQARVWGALSERGRRPGSNSAPSKQSDRRHLRGNTAVWHIPNPNPPTFTVSTTATNTTPNRIAEREVWFTLHDVAPKCTTTQLLHILKSIRSERRTNWSLDHLLLILLGSASCCIVRHHGSIHMIKVSLAIKPSLCITKYLDSPSLWSRRQHPNNRWN